MAKSIQEMEMKCDVLILDGRHLLWRTSDAFRDLSVEVDGELIGTGGIYGFLSVAMKIHQRYGGNVMVAWEGESNFRQDMFPDYKRKEEPDEDRLEMIRDMNAQELRLKALLRAVGVRQYLADHCEADDVMGTIAAFMAKKKKLVVIYTGDSDLRQCVDDGSVYVISPARRASDVFYNEAKVLEKHGVTPDQIPDLKALSGDTSDNIPGIRGIGPKTAAKAIQALGDVKQIIRAAHSGSEWPIAERFKQPILENKREILLYKALATIRRDASLKPIPGKRSQKTVTEHLMAYKFRSLMAPLELKQLMAMGS